MIFVKHSELVGKHCLFSPSKPGWINYSVPKLFERIDNEAAKTTGTLIHEYAASQIYLSHKVSSKKVLVQQIENYIYQKYWNERYQELDPYTIELIKKVGPIVDNIFNTIKNYINDSIGYKMVPEQVLKYSDNFFGTTDAIVFRNKSLRIHDLKTGQTPAKMEQLLVYAALFCLEYKVKPGDIETELRIYQTNEVLIDQPTAEDILPIMDQIVSFDKAIGKGRLTNESYSD